MCSDTMFRPYWEVIVSFTACFALRATRGEFCKPSPLAFSARTGDISSNLKVLCCLVLATKLLLYACRSCLQKVLFRSTHMPLELTFQTLVQRCATKPQLCRCVRLGHIDQAVKEYVVSCWNRSTADGMELAPLGARRHLSSFCLMRK